MNVRAALQTKVTMLAAALSLFAAIGCWAQGPEQLTAKRIYSQPSLSGRLNRELIEHGKYVEVMPFPGRGHGVSDAPARIVLMNRVTQFFLESLGHVH